MKKMKNVLKKAMKNKGLAAAIIGQVIVDEAFIGTDQIVIGYHSKENAEAIWKIANKWGWANKLQNSRYIDNRKPNEIKRNWRFSLKRNFMKEIYKIIGPLPDRSREGKMKLFLRNNYRQHKPSKKPLKERIIKEVKNGPRTVEDLVRKFKMSGSLINKNLKFLKEEKVIVSKRINGYGKLEYNFNSPRSCK